MAEDKKILAVCGPVEIQAAEASGEGERKKRPKFNVVAYRGGALKVSGWDAPVVIDLAGLKMARSVVANYGHDDDQPVGHVTDAKIGTTELALSGSFSFEGAATDRILAANSNEFPWEASVEVAPEKYDEIPEGETARANGQEFTGPVYVARKSTLYGFGFVLHGADTTTSVAIAATAATSKEKVTMVPEFKSWAEAMLPGVDIEAMPAQAVKNLQADWEGRSGERAKPAVADPGSRLLKKKLEASRRQDIDAMAEQWSDNAIELGRYADVKAINDTRDEAIKAGTSVKDFEYELRIATLTNSPPAIHVKSDAATTGKVLEAAICQHGRLKDIEKHYDDQTQQTAHDAFKGRISLREVYIAGAQANGYGGRTGQVDMDLHNAAFGLSGNNGRMVRGFGFSTMSLPNVMSNVANKFIRDGWMSVDQTILRISATRSVSDFKAITTVSLTGAMQFLPIGPDGEFKHGELGEQTYTNQVFPAGIMFAITFVDIRNDDIGALTAVPRRIGRGGMLYLNHIGWTEFLNNSSFFQVSANNVNTGVADMTVGGLAATKTIFMDQVDYDSKPLAAEPRIILVPTPLKSQASTLMASDKLITGTGGVLGDANPFRGRFQVESSPYMSNSAYTGFSAAAWYMLADPSVLPVLEIAALDGQVQPTVESADAAFNVLGTQMRGHSHVGVNLQEPKGGVRADGGSS